MSTSWNPMAEDFEDQGLSTYKNGPAKDYARSKDGHKPVGVYISRIPLNYDRAYLEGLFHKSCGGVMSVTMGRCNQYSILNQCTYAIVKLESLRYAEKMIEKFDHKPPYYFNVKLAHEKYNVDGRKLYNDNITTGLECPKEKSTNSSFAKENPKPASVGRGKCLINSISKSKVVENVNDHLSLSSKINGSPKSEISVTRYENAEIKINDNENLPSDESPTKTFNGLPTPTSDQNCSSSSHSDYNSEQPSKSTFPPCVKCRKQNAKKRCRICKAPYCSRNCQESDWYIHKEHCTPPPPLEDVFDEDVSNKDNEVISQPSDISISDKGTSRNKPSSSKSSSEIDDFIEINKKIFTRSTPGKVTYQEEFRRPFVTRSSDKSPKEVSPKDPCGEIDEVISKFILDCKNKIISPKTPPSNHFKDTTSSLKCPKNEPTVVGEVISVTPIEESSCGDKQQMASAKQKSAKGAVKFDSPESVKSDKKSNVSSVDASSMLTANEIYEGVVTICESVDNFCMMFLCEKTEHVFSLSNDLDLASLNPLSSSEVTAGDVVLAESSEDGAWYRAIVWPSNSSSEVVTEVYYIDYGNKDSISRMLALPAKLKITSIPSLGFSAHLQTIISHHSRDDLSQIIMTSPKVSFKVKSKSGNKILISILKDGDEWAEYNLISTIDIFKQQTSPPMDHCKSAIKNSPPMDHCKSAIKNSPQSLTHEMKPHSVSPRKNFTKFAEHSKAHSNKSMPVNNHHFYRKDLSARPLAKGKEYYVLITHLDEDNEEIYVHLSTDECQKSMMTLVHLIQKHCENAAVPSQVVVNELLCAHCSEDEMWHRCEVLENDDQNAIVNFVDFGNSSSIPLKDVRVFDNLLVKFPIMAAKLKVLPDVDFKMIKSLLRKYISDQTRLAIKIVNVDPIRVKFYTLTGQELFNTEKSIVVASKTLQDEISSKLGDNNKIQEEPKAMEQLKSGTVNPVIFTYEDCKSLSLPIEKNVQAVVIHCTDPNNVFIISMENVGYLEKISLMADSMNNFCNSFSKRYYQPKEGEICFAKFSEDEAWYRSTCIAVDEESAWVMFVDYGNIEKVPFENLIQMVDKYLEIPLLAAHCRIQGFTVDNVLKGGSSLKEKFQSLICPQSVHTINVVARDEEDLVYEIQFPSLTKELLKILL